MTKIWPRGAILIKVGKIWPRNTILIKVTKIWPTDTILIKDDGNMANRYHTDLGW